MGSQEEMTKCLTDMVGYEKHRENRLKTPNCRESEGGCKFLFDYNYNLATYKDY